MNANSVPINPLVHEKSCIQESLMPMLNLAPRSTGSAPKTIWPPLWAATCDFQQCGILTSVDSDEPVQPPLKLRNSKWCSVSSLTLRIFKWLANTLIRLRICAGWSEALLVAHTTLLEISCGGSYNIHNSKRTLRSFKSIIAYLIK